MFEIDKYSRNPIYEQIIDYIKSKIECDEIIAEEILPSVRVLSQQLNVNPNTLQRAYSELERQGICYSVAGNGRYVSKNAKEILIKQKKKSIIEIEKLSGQLRQAGVSLQKIIDAVKAGYGEENV